MELLNCDIAYSVYKSKNYNLFKFIKSNRDISKTHVEKLVTQIEADYEFPPIIVKPNGEILDGQHRFTALKQCGKPIEFIIRNEIKQDTLQKSNQFVSKWNLKDHINFFSLEGNEDYQELDKDIQYTNMTPATAARIIGTTGKVSTSTGIPKGIFKITSKDDAYNFYDDVYIRIKLEKVPDKIILSLKRLYDLGIDNKLLVNSTNVLLDELLLMSKHQKIIEHIAKLYNKNCDKEDKIIMEYSKNGSLLLK
ncbi:hypothetical protein BFS35_012220 [Macrococcoides goetzii]|uniref:Uncharacterized protein n=1 Tax=Macrococcoides goetzii TaxID=1891097 RepID=A0A2G5NV52_9STAP|nr:ParB/RepB/Spo0J family partition protein [Macrococcus goetzii]RAI79318.1 hypothetical protein BFS35_012220 [Macrococcus goetzii]